jgi:peptidoglycan/LPS O-acetylase OafA/YrhL
VARPGDGRIGALDGLRSAAIGLVLFYHLTPGHDSNHGLRTLPFKIADIGWIGVDLFFVLSGFLITSKLIAARRDSHRFRDFYARRALRIFPLYYGVLLLIILIVPLVSRSIPVDPLPRQLPFWLYYTNFVRAPLAIERYVTIWHFWSLAVEEQFYLLWPAAVFLLSNRAGIRLCLGITLASPILRLALAMHGASWITTYAWTPSRAEGLALGALIAFAYAERWERRRLVAIAAIGFAFSVPLLAWAAWRDLAGWVETTITSTIGIVVRTALPAAAAWFSVSLLITALECRPISRLLSGRIQEAVARYSYGLYVFHYMLYLPLCALLLPHLAGWSPNAAATLFFVIATALAMLLAIVSYHTLEVFFLSLKSRLTGH